MIRKEKETRLSYNCAHLKKSERGEIYDPEREREWK